jgi:hypothetical protein
MGREARDDGGEKMKHSAIYLLFVMLVFGIVTASPAETEYAQYLPKWLELLKMVMLGKRNWLFTVFGFLSMGN